MLFVSSAASRSFPAAQAARKALAVRAASSSVTGPLPFPALTALPEAAPAVPCPLPASSTSVYTPYAAPPTIARNTPPTTAPFAAPFTYRPLPRPPDL